MAYNDKYISKLEDIARHLRITTLEMIHKRGAGHPGGSLSAAEIIAALYFHKMKIDPSHPDDPDRDRFILSKGHASAILYAALAERGYFPKEDLKEWGSLDCHLQGHPEREKTPGVDMTTGILGHGINIGSGLALSAKMTDRRFRTFVLVGDGECQGGIIWEGIMTAARYKLDNLTVIVDFNDVQLNGFVHEIMPLEPFIDKWKAFNWAAIEIDGHNVHQIICALNMVENIHDRPTVIVARTIKGKGVSFMENKHMWHGVAPTAEELEKARKELSGGSS